MSDTFTCPHCGAEVPWNAAACPECGSDENTGWSDDTVYDGLFLYDDDDAPASGASRFSSWVKVMVSFLLVLALAVGAAASLRRGFFIILLVLLAAGAIYYLTQVYPHTGRGRRRELYRDLLRKARGDADLVERWLNYEQRRNPGADEIELMEDAIYRWERDNR